MIENVNSEDILSEELSEALKDNYSLTKIMYSTINRNGQEDSGIFLVRNIRHMEQNVSPGVLIVKLNQDFYDNIFFDVNQHTPAVYAMVTMKVRFAAGREGKSRKKRSAGKF